VKKTIIFLFVISVSILATSQTANDKVFSAFSHYGSVFQTNGFIKGENRLDYPVKRFADISLRYEIQTNGSESWHALYDYPSYGFGLYLIDFKDKGLLRTPFAAYAFLSVSYWQSKRFDIRGEFALGLATNWDYFSRDNILNTAIGSPVTCYFDYGFHLYYKTNSNFDIGFGVSSTHFSNGALRKPNRGINVIAPRLAVKYSGFNEKGSRNAGSDLAHSKDPLPSSNSFTFVISAFGGVFGHYYRAYNYGIADSIFQKQFLVCGLSPSVLYNFNIKHSLGIGLDVAYFDMAGKSLAIKDESIVMSDEVGFMEKLNAAVFLAYEYRMHNFALTIEPAIYLYKYNSQTENSIYDAPAFYQRIGVRWQFSKHCFVGLKLRAYRFSIAHFIEWNVGVKL
jgi:hypothetical protein